MSTGLRWVAAALGILIAMAVLGLCAAGTAAAHPTLLFTDPAADTAVPVAPQAITLVFNEPVTIGADAIVLLDKNGRTVPTEPATTARGGQALTARPTAPLPPGSYTVRWRETGTDGDLVEEEFRFGVGSALTAAAPGAGGASIAWLSAALRWLLFAAFAIAFGGLIAGRFTATARAENPKLPAPRSLIAGALVAALAAAAGLAAQVVVEAGRLDVLWRDGSGAVVSVEGAGLAAALALLAMRRRAWALLPLLMVIGAEGWRSHAHTAAGTWGAVLTGVHLAAAATWVGALVATTLAVLAWRREPAAVRWVITGYMRLAVWTFAVVVGTGVVSALLLLPLSQVFTTDYGRVLVIKLALVAGAATLALTGRWIQRSETRIPKLPTVIRAESLTLVAVLALSATLVSTPPVKGAAQPAPPQPTGPVLPMGALRPDRGRRRRQRRATGGAALGAATRGLLRRPTRPALHPVRPVRPPRRHRGDTDVSRLRAGVLRGAPGLGGRRQRAERGRRRRRRKGRGGEPFSAVAHPARRRRPGPRGGRDPRRRRAHRLRIGHQ
jgi:copper transport protein